MFQKNEGNLCRRFSLKKRHQTCPLLEWNDLFASFDYQACQKEYLKTSQCPSAH